MEGIIFFIAAFAISYFFTPKTLNMLKMGGLMKSNCHGMTIPSTAGIIFSAVLAITYVLLAIFYYVNVDAYIYLGFISLISLAGLVDDVAGNRDNRGFTGHFSFLLQKREFTTGIWKAGLGGIVAVLAAAAFSITWWDILINTLLVALMANVFNLLDVCPGRSIKVFFLASLLVMLFLPSYTANILLYPIAGAVGAYAVYDFQGKAMMGDAGSNLIGLALGLAIMAGGNMGTRIIIVILLLLLHVVSERFSFSQVINNNKVLFLLDRLGRRDEFGRKN